MAAKKSIKNNQLGGILIVVAGLFAVVAGMFGTYGSEFMQGVATGFGAGVVLVGLVYLTKK